MYIQDTVAALATPPGRGGIAVLRLSGPDSFAIAERVFCPKNKKKSIHTAGGYTALLGVIYDGADELDEGIALIFRAPHSYTGEDVVELSCHGGEGVSRSVLAALYKAGARPATPGEFTKRAVLNGRLSLTQAEAVMDLISATSKSGQAAALAAQRGRLHEAITLLKEELIQLAGHLAAWVDYPEEDVEELTEERFKKSIKNAIKILQKMVDDYGQGAIARSGVRTVIVGSPNVGKSTLFNLMSGFDAAIVTPVAGTTRDVVRQPIEVGAVTLLLSDTAGLQTTEDVVEQEGIRRSRQELDEAQLAIAVFDASRKLDEEQQAFAKSFVGRPALAIVNKSDLGSAFDAEAIRPYFTRLLVVSATEDANTKEAVAQAVAEVLGMDSFDANSAQLAGERQLNAANRALQALRSGEEALALGLPLDAAGVCLDDALHALAELTGEDATEAIIDEVFSKFCVGK